MLDRNGQGVGVIVTFDSQAPDCLDLRDPLAGARLDEIHANLVGVMLEVIPPQSGPGVVSALRLNGSGGQLDLTWQPDCGTGTRYAIYRGNLAAGYGSLAAELRSVMGTTASVPVGAGTADFFLVVPNRQHREGSYGLDSRGIRRLPAGTPCYLAGGIDSCAP